MASSVVSFCFFAIYMCVSFGLPIQETDIIYYIYNNQTYNEKLDSETLNLVDVSLPINYVIRGCFDSKGNGSWVGELVDAYLDQQDLNVIVVDWRSEQEEDCPNSVEEVKQIGHQVGNLISAIYGDCGGNLSDVHIIGHSIGAHVAGFAGKRVQELTEMSVGRITALDAAYPNFLLVKDNNRLSKDDAELVVAIHTDGGFSGFKERIGHVDLYPNGGVAPQPGCPERISTCSHEKAFEYFVDAVSKPTEFVAKLCSSYAQYDMGLCDDSRSLAMGAPITAEDEGVYYLRINQ